MGLKLGLTYDLRSEYLAMGYREADVAEFDMDETVDLLEAALQRCGYATERIGSAKSLCRRLVGGERWDLVFNIAEGLRGRCREAQVPALLELYEIPYTFSDPLVCAATLDKAVAKRLVRAQGLPTARFHVVRDERSLRSLNLTLPVFAKPLAEGTGKGVDARSHIGRADQLEATVLGMVRRYRQPVLVEEFLPGAEFTVGLLGNGADARVLGVMEIAVPRDPRGIYSYTSKEECATQVTYRPLREGRLCRQLADLALKAYRVLECRDAARADFRCDAQGEPNFLEINPLPGLHPEHSDLPMIARQEGMSYEDLLRSIVEAARARQEEAGERCTKAS